MSVTATLDDRTINRLQKLPFVVPLVDDINSAVNKLIDEYYRGNGGVGKNGAQAVSRPARVSTNVREFNPASPPNLTHTKVLSATLDGGAVAHSWKALLEAVIRAAKPLLAADAKRLIIVNFVRGKKEDEGYHYIPEVGLSVQGQDANAAWKAIFHVANQMGAKVEVEFLWRDKDGAAHPGVTGRLSV